MIQEDVSTMIKYGFLALILALLIGGVLMYFKFQTQANQQKEVQEYLEVMSTLSAEEVIEQHFKWKNDQNLEGLALTMYAEEISEVDFTNIKSVELLSISNVDDSMTLSQSLKATEWFPNNFYDSKIFIVEFTIERRAQYGHNDGWNEFIYILVKESEDSSWKIYRRSIY